MSEQKLREIFFSQQITEPPHTRKYHGKWVEVTVAIGPDETVYISMTDDAMKALIERTSPPKEQETFWLCTADGKHFAQFGHKKCRYCFPVTEQVKNIITELQERVKELEYNLANEETNAGLFIKERDQLTAENERLKLDLKAIRSLSRNYSAVLEHYGEIRRIAEQALADKDYLPKRSEK